MKYKLATTLLVVAGLVVATFSATTTPAAPAAPTRARRRHLSRQRLSRVDTKSPPCNNDDVVLQWNEQLLRHDPRVPGRHGPDHHLPGARRARTPPSTTPGRPTIRRKVTLPNGNSEQPANDANKSKAISYAAYRTLVDLFPYRQQVFDHRCIRL